MPVPRLARSYIAISSPQANLLACLPLQSRLDNLRTGAAGLEGRVRLAALYRAYRELFLATPYLERQGLLQAFDEASDCRRAPWLLEGLESYSPEEFAAFVEMVGPDRLELAAFGRCVDRFAGFLEHELVLADPGFRRVGGRVEVSRRRMEPHTCARIGLHLLGGSADRPALLAPLEPLLQAYLAREWRQLSLEDHAGLLGAMLSHFEPSEPHADFFKQRLPDARLHTYPAAVVLLDLAATVSLVEGSHHIESPARLFQRALELIRDSLPFMSDWRLSDKAAFIPLAALALLRASGKQKPGPEAWDLLFAGFQDNVQFLSHYQVAVFLESASRAGATAKSPTLLRHVCAHFTENRDCFSFEDNVHAAFVLDLFANKADPASRTAVKDKLRAELSQTAFRSMRLQKSVDRLEQLFKQEPDVLRRVRQLRDQNVSRALADVHALGSDS